MPSVGKSTIISKISNSKPKIAAYHFTTLKPNLGVVKARTGKTFVLADLPGLIEGASLGAGLGDKFLKHVERTKVIAHVIDMAATEGRDPYDDYVLINKELGDFNKKLEFLCGYLFEHMDERNGNEEWGKAWESLKNFADKNFMSCCLSYCPNHFAGLNIL